MDGTVERSESDSSEGSASDEFFHDSIEARKDNREFSDIDYNETVISNSRSVLDLRNVPSIPNIVKSDDETSEKLSAVIEQPEEHVNSEMIVTNDTTGSPEDPDKILCKRIKSLQAVIIDLREQLKVELLLWKKEREEFRLLRERSDILALQEATAAARAAAQAYAAESPLSSEIGNIVDLNPMQSLSELTILKYERKLAKYQDALALAQAEKRYNMRRNLIAETYRRRLIEVERLCNEELETIRQNAKILQPLVKIASQWSIENGGNHGDGNRDWNCTIMSEKSEKPYLVKIDDDRETRKTESFDAEVNMIPESISARFLYKETSKYDRHATVKNTKSSQSHLLIESNSLPSNWYASSSNF